MEGRKCPNPSFAKKRCHQKACGSIWGTRTCLELVLSSVTDRCRCGFLCKLNTCHSTRHCTGHPGTRVSLGAVGCRDRRACQLRVTPHALCTQALTPRDHRTKQGLPSAPFTGEETDARQQVKALAQDHQARRGLTPRPAGARARAPHLPGPSTVQGLGSRLG